jgi:MoaA/NifB/PqqE/SkfB family radical SAM enzyme
MARSIVAGQVSAYKLKALLTNLYYAWRKIPSAPYGPTALWIEPVNYCNLQCSGCWVPRKQKHTKNKPMSMETFKGNIDSVKDTLVLLMLQMSGEPFLHKSIFDMIRYAGDNDIVVWTSTNGSYKTDGDWGYKVVDSKLDTLYISISGINQMTYELYHQGGSIENVKENIKKINEAKKDRNSKTPFMYFRALITDKNRQELTEIKKLASRLNVGVHVRIINTSYEYEGVPVKEPESSDVEIRATFEPEKLHNHCYGLWIAPALTSSNRLLPCCYDWLYPPAVGSADGLDTTIKDVWHSASFNRFRENILTNRRMFDSCRYCDNSIGFKDGFSKRNNNIIIRFKKQ